MTEGTQARVVLVTAPGAEIAERMVRTLLEERVVACGNIVPGLTSIYRWQGAVEREPEALIVLKTTAAEVPRLLARVPELHPYEVPEILVLPVLAGHEPYLSWIAQSVGAGEKD
ncbi:MAG TPA: divalent-cation tolerance protein CutA [Longimicrobiales bacterium]|nr:divalent-cation tolerance protein CutA [Longimicrobiales bacterium]